MAENLSLVSDEPQASAYEEARAISSSSNVLECLLGFTLSRQHHVHFSATVEVVKGGGWESTASLMCMECELNLLVCRWLIHRVRLDPHEEAVLMGSDFAGAALYWQAYSAATCSGRSTICPPRIQGGIPHVLQFLVENWLCDETFGCKNEGVWSEVHVNDVLRHRLRHVSEYLSSAHHSCSTLAELESILRIVERTPAELSLPVSVHEMRQLLEVYSSVYVEQTCFLLFQHLQRSGSSYSSESNISASSEDEMPLSRAVPAAFRQLIHAQDVAQLAIALFGSEASQQLLQDTVRPLLSYMSSASDKNSSQPPYLHGAVALSSHPALVVDGVGMIATEAIDEGSLLLVEESYWAAQWSRPGRGCPPKDAAISSVAVAAASLHDKLVDILREGKRGIRTSWLRSDDGQSSLDIWRGHAESTTHAMASTVLLHALRQLVVSSEAIRAYLQLLSTFSTGGSDGRTDERKQVAAPEEYWDNVMRSVLSETEVAASLGPWNCQRPRVFATRELDEFCIGIDSFCDKEEEDDCPSLGKRSGGYRHTWENGRAVFSLLQCVNHSCLPNALLMFHPPSCDEQKESSRDSPAVMAVVVAMREIAPAEEITVAYVPSIVSFTTTEEERVGLLNFNCHCVLCREKIALLHGVVCPFCNRLVYCPPGGPKISTPTACSTADRPLLEQWTGFGKVRRAVAFAHSSCCPYIRESDNATRKCMSSMEKIFHSALAVARQRCREVHCHSAKTDTQLGHCTHGPDPIATAIRHLLDIDSCVKHRVPPSYSLRLRLCFEMLVCSAVAVRLRGSMNVELMQMTIALLESLELLLQPNHPLVSGVRMFFVFSRGRHIAAVSAAEDLSSGRRLDDCCGAVREQAALMKLPFVIDPILRGCVVRSFQEHHVQTMGWRCGKTEDEHIELSSFLQRYSVELEAAGITTTEHIELLSCMEENQECSP